MHIRLARRRTAGAVAGLALAGLLAAAVSPASATASSGDSSVAAPGSGDGPGGLTVEYFPQAGGSGHTTRVPSDGPARSAKARRGTTPLTAAEARTDGALGRQAVTGPSEDRLDVVIVGDGYTAGQQGDFHADATAKWADITAIEPYKSYQGLFNVWTVDAVSKESGISGDPTADVVRDTALGSGFWCDGIERLICADIDKVASYAAKAPAADLVVVLSNSTKYGGAGYSGLTAEGYPFNGVSTLSSDNASSSLIAAHEIGHSVGLLADEYTYDSYGTWTGGEPADLNSTTYTPAQLTEKRAKWYRWLGQTDPAGGTVGTFEGSSYYPFGIYRPTASSLMRELSNTEFNLPGREAMIAGFYRAGSALSSTRAAGSTLAPGHRITVSTAGLGGTDRHGRPGAGKALAAPDLRWYVDGKEKVSARGRTTVTPLALGVRHDGRRHTVTVTFVDRTDAIRDPAVRALSGDELSWTVKATGPRR
ncbi:M64 family metallopeptidase [Streptomyces sp. BE308]|uniref:M64 family metallopeptidase n=1 Tax=Streptomyces sp. BE308 TaxID=3002529 RepID=UPI002E774141|nr:M64 family metallopeptidase [Streptomyces sp. BE308]MEE1796513.1 M64 family metallopeptidase [Streptomyces sp. BE308]